MNQHFDRIFLPFQDCDVHFFAALFKVYLRELPLPLFVSTEKKANSGEIYKQWMRIIRSDIMSLDEKIKEIRQVIQVNFAPNVQRNIQYIVKFLAELTKKSGQNKMTSHNLGIVIGPAVLWNPELRTCDPAQIETEIKVNFFEAIYEKSFINIIYRLSP